MPANSKIICTIFGITLCTALSSCGEGTTPNPPQATSQLQPQTATAPAAEPVPANLPKWEPDPKVLPLLKEPINSVQLPPRFTMQIPLNYQLAPREEALRKEYMFFGPVRKDKTRVAFLVSVLNGKMGGAKQAPTLSEAMTAFQKSMQSGRRRRWKNTPVEDGLINGVHFQRIYWQGDEPTSQELMKGFIYATKVGDEIFEFAAQDMAKYEKEGITQLDSAVRTVKMLP